MPSIAVDPGRVHVAVGVIRDKYNNILIARRPRHLHAGGLWEFPGGKVEKGETVVEALHRELWEELGITVTSERALMQIHHDYPEKKVLLDVWEVLLRDGSPVGLQGQDLQWVSPGELSGFDFPQANHRIVNRLQLPHWIMITGAFNGEEDFLRKLESALIKGIRCVQLRAHALDDKQYSRLYWKAREYCDNYGAILIVNTAPDLHQQLNARGLHLTSTRLLECKSRPVDKHVILGASCHSQAEIRHANRIDVDYVTLGAVFQTPSHPQQQGMGLEQFSILATSSNAPVFALGGIKENMLDLVCSVGGFGIAGISEFWSTDK